MVGSVRAASIRSFSEVLGVRAYAQGVELGIREPLGKETYKSSSGIYRREMAARRDDDNINMLTRAAAVVLHREVRVCR
jgi:methyl coenzyme M reductase gamma subunit